AADRTTQTRAELILLVLRFGPSGFRKKILGVKLGVPEEFISAAVKQIRSGFGNHVDGCAGVPSLLRLEQIRLNFKFEHRFNGGPQGDQTVAAKIVVNAIE